MGLLLLEQLCSSSHCCRRLPTLSVMLLHLSRMQYPVLLQQLSHSSAGRLLLLQQLCLCRCTSLV
jgi:hypothetical protein